MKILTLNLKREYFEAIKNGTKTEEYRECSVYWRRRLGLKHFDKVRFCLGYPKKGDKDRIITADYGGYILKKIIHPHFNNVETKVFAIQFNNVRQFND